MEKLNRAAKCSILGPQNLGSGGGPGPRGPPPGSAAATSSGKETPSISVFGCGTQVPDDDHMVETPVDDIWVLVSMWDDEPEG